MKKFAEHFYKSKQWQKTRDAYFKSQQGLCEICREQGRITPGEIVHHTIHLTEETINDPNISLSWSNLQVVCREHHAMLHKINKKRYYFDEMGHVISLE